MHERAKRARPLCRATQGDARLGGHGRALGTVRLRPVRGDIVLGEGPGDALVLERLEVARRRDMHPPAVAPGERAVCDLADESLDEPVLAALGRPRIGLEGQHLAADEVAQPSDELVCRQAAHGGEGVDGECLADDRCGLQQ